MSRRPSSNQTTSHQGTISIYHICVSTVDHTSAVISSDISYMNVFGRLPGCFEKNLGPFIFIARGGAPVGAHEGAPTRALDAMFRYMIYYV